MTKQKVSVPKGFYLSDISGKDIGPGKIKLTFSTINNKTKKKKYVTLKKGEYASTTTANSKNVTLTIKKIK